MDKDLFGKYAKPPKKTKRTERGDCIDLFLQYLVPSWDAQKYGKLTPGRLRFKLTGIPTKDLYYIHKVCLDSKHYSKRFFFELNPKKHDV